MHAPARYRRRDNGRKPYQKDEFHRKQGHQLRDACTQHFADADFTRPLVGSERRKTEKTHTGDEDGDAHGDVQDLRCLPFLRVKLFQRFVKEPGLERVPGYIFLKTDSMFVISVFTLLAERPALESFTLSWNAGTCLRREDKGSDLLMHIVRMEILHYTDYMRRRYRAVEAANQLLADGIGRPVETQGPCR
jgi:hypothetical protein